MLLDSPATNPALGFTSIAQAFASIIETSEPRFAIGIFGDWGSGKTTLMDAIEGKLSAEKAIPVRFNAWRYEREPELLVPLLDTIRQSLVDWGDARKGAEPGKKALTAARRIGRVVRALVAGAAVEVTVAPGAKVKYEAGKAVEQLRADTAADRARDADEQPQSLYFAGFKQLSEALDEFGADNVARIVVFVDDLDRCLPSNALDVLEAMKLFFDLPGFVFVVGLDEDIVERAVQTRFAELASESAGNGASATTSRETTPPRTRGEYVKKLFQVPYSLPPMLAEQLDELLDAMYSEAKLEQEQLDDLQTRVRRYLQYVARDGRINPREVKRFVNAYTLQTLVRPELQRDVVLALQTIAFRAEWEVAYDLILADSAMFTEAARSFRSGDADALEAVWPTGSAVPSDFAAYVSSRDVEPLVDAPDLEPYLFSLQSTRSSQPWLVDAYRAVGELRRTLREIRGIDTTGGADANRLASDLGDHAGRLESLMSDVSDEETASRLGSLLASIQRRAGELSTSVVGGAAPPSVAPIADGLEETLERLQAELRVVRRRSVLAMTR